MRDVAALVRLMAMKVLFEAVPERVQVGVPHDGLLLVVVAPVVRLPQDVREVEDRVPGIVSAAAGPSSDAPVVVPVCARQHLHFKQSTHI